MDSGHTTVLLLTDETALSSDGSMARLSCLVVLVPPHRGTQCGVRPTDVFHSDGLALSISGCSGKKFRDMVLAFSRGVS